jgi:hypothetical protein
MRGQGGILVYNEQTKKKKKERNRTLMKLVERGMEVKGYPPTFTQHSTAQHNTISNHNLAPPHLPLSLG